MGKDKFLLTKKVLGLIIVAISCILSLIKGFQTSFTLLVMIFISVLFLDEIIAFLLKYKSIKISPSGLELVQQEMDDISKIKNNLLSSDENQTNININLPNNLLMSLIQIRTCINKSLARLCLLNGMEYNHQNLYNLANFAMDKHLIEIHLFEGIKKLEKLFNDLAHNTYLPDILVGEVVELGKIVLNTIENKIQEMESKAQTN